MARLVWCLNLEQKVWGSSLGEINMKQIVLSKANRNGEQCILMYSILMDQV